MSLSKEAEELLGKFQSNNSWEQKMRLLMQVSNTTNSLTASEKIMTNEIKGCESQVWLVIIPRDNHYYFKAASDAKLMQGLLVTLLIRINGLTSAQIAIFDLEDWFKQLGLTKQLSSSRREGLKIIFQEIKNRLIE